MSWAHKMRGHYKRKDAHRKSDETTEIGGGLLSGHSPLPGESASSSDGPNSPISGSTTLSLDDGGINGPKCSNSDGEKRYLGVRVKMPVRDMLRNIRLAKGWDPLDFQENCGKASKGEKKRVNTCGERRTNKRKRPTKSLEELAIIVEVLEEDLKTGNTYSPPRQDYSPSNQPASPKYNPDIPWGPEPQLHSYSLNNDPENPILRATDYRLTNLNSRYDESNTYTNCLGLHPLASHQGRGYNSDESDDTIPSPQSYVSYSPAMADYCQAPSPSDSAYASNRPPDYDVLQDGDAAREEGRRGEGEDWSGPQNWNVNSDAFFWAQLQREESQLRDVSDSVLLTTDGHGRTALHSVVVLGKRAQGYAIAKRMAALNSLDLKDSEGMTALHLAAKQNQHLMVADLIHQGASVNARDSSGKTCLHLSAENGYIRVLEVLKLMMKDGVYVDVEATDNNGLSVLQCAAVALSSTVRELESASPSQTRLHTLRKEQMMETLECLLQMGSYLHIQSCGYGENAFEVEHKMETDRFMQGVASTWGTM